MFITEQLDSSNFAHKPSRRFIEIYGDDPLSIIKWYILEMLFNCMLFSLRHTFPVTVSSQGLFSLWHQTPQYPVFTSVVDKWGFSAVYEPCGYNVISQGAIMGVMMCVISGNRIAMLHILSISTEWLKITLANVCQHRKVKSISIFLLITLINKLEQIRNDMKCTNSLLCF